MATMITAECVACGACEDECPTGAISLGDAIFEIDPARCTECEGFFDAPRCAAACPVECCVPDPSRHESKEVLLARADEMRAEVTCA